MSIVQHFLLVIRERFFTNPTIIYSVFVRRRLALVKSVTLFSMINVCCQSKSIASEDSILFQISRSLFLRRCEHIQRRQNIFFAGF